MFYERYATKFYRQNIFDLNKFDEISENDFDEEVINYRSSYDMYYDDKMNRIFVDKNCGLLYKVVRLPKIEIIEI